MTMSLDADPSWPETDDMREDREVREAQSVFFEERIVHEIARTLNDHNLAEETLVELLRVIGVNADNGFFADAQIDMLKHRYRKVDVLWPWFEMEEMEGEEE